MAVILEGITLPDLVIDNEFSNLKIRAEEEKSLSGRSIIWEQSTSFKPIDLIGGDDFGWISRTDLLQVQAFAEVAGATYTLNYEGTIYTVRFRNEDAPAIETDLVVPRSNPEGGDWYHNLRIKLMEIN